MKNSYCAMYLNEIEENLTVGQLEKVKALYDDLSAKRDNNIFELVRIMAIIYELGKKEGANNARE